MMHQQASYARLQSLVSNYNQIESLRWQRLKSFADQQLEAACIKARESIRSIADYSIVDGKVTFRGDVDSARMRPALEAFHPWKKGPFDFFGIEIDAEWRSDWKWQRILPYLREGGRVADIGCNNCYFMYRLEKECRPELVVGMEPIEKYWHHFRLSESCRPPQDRILLEPFGVDELSLFPEFFDQVLLLGILYHHRDPLKILKDCALSLRKGGEVIIDCQGMAGDDAHVFIPPGKYAGASGIWWVPTVKALTHWLKRSGFQKIDVFFSEPLSIEEQRSTPWAQIQSLGDFLRPDGRTIEGHPQPWRHYIKASR